MTTGRGIAQLITEGRILTFTDPAFAFLGPVTFHSLPLPVWMWLATAVLVTVLMRCTALGLIIKAVGINHQAWRVAG
ncbi:hypothetical protein [Gemmobacter sp. 24YEA27]|uniref:hypothetical protein n=1 Tax=Gemmobacter sp. 24YEA27 TaxID=3040672 RepID=UPI0024B3B27E|nr:hypothetical protein [Gemmobacter sp. 24YEA27]